MSINKNISVWRGNTAPPTVYHLWIKNGLIYVYNSELKSWINMIEDNSALLIYGTSEDFSHTNLVSKKNSIYVYTDRIETGNSIKIGDGSAYLVDIPFLDTYITDHINNTDIHVTPEEKQFWDNKITCVLDEDNLIFSKK